MGQSHLFTSESVTEGHPDKIADQISDGVLDAVLADDPYGTGRLRDAHHHRPGHGGRRDLDLDLRRHPPDRARHDPAGSATTGPSTASTARPAASRWRSTSSRPDIAQGVDHALEARGRKDSDPYDLQGAGDQGLMFGYASDETAELMPLPIILAHRLCERLAAMRRSSMTYLRPDGKSQVTVRYEDGAAGGGHLGGDLHPARPRRVGRAAARRGHRPGRSPGARGLRDVPALGHHVLHQPHRALRGRRPARRRRPHRAQDHRRHLRRHGAPRRRRLLRARTPPRSTARPPTPRAGSRRTSSRPASRGAARCRWPTRSASPTRCR